MRSEKVECDETVCEVTRSAEVRRYHVGACVAKPFGAALAINNAGMCLHSQESLNSRGRTVYMRIHRSNEREMRKVSFNLNITPLQIRSFPCSLSTKSNDLLKLPPRPTLLALQLLLPIILRHDSPPRLSTHTASHTASPDLRLLLLDIYIRSLGRGSLRIAVNEEIAVIAEIRVNVLESSSGGFGVEEVDEWYEGEVEDGPDDVEAPAEGFDARRRDFDDDEIAEPVGCGA